MLNITKELIFYVFKINNNFFLLIISGLFGWNVIKIQSCCVLFKNKNNFSQIYGIFLLRNFLGCYSFFLQYVFLRGMGYKILLVKSYLILKLSQSHRIVYKVKKNVKIILISKQVLIIKSKSIDVLKKIVFFLKKFGKTNAYKKKGIFLKGSIISIKVSSKKSKF